MRMYSSFYDEQLETKIEMELFNLGFRPDLKGFDYIRDAVIMLINDPDIIFGITKNIYPRIAKESNTKPSDVEHAIRRSIKVAWEYGSLHNYFSHYPKRPTNRTVLAFLFKYINSNFGSNDSSLVLIK